MAYKSIGITTSQTEGQNRSVSVQVTWDKSIPKSWPSDAKKGLMSMAADVASRARLRAPYVTGALKNSIYFNPYGEDDTVEVTAGGNWAKMDNPPPGAFKITRFVDYAALREQGPNRNPATEHYMEYGLKDILNTDWQHRYFSNLKGVTK